jgi:hypothetical protein
MKKVNIYIYMCTLLHININILQNILIVPTPDETLNEWIM